MVSDALCHHTYSHALHIALIDLVVMRHLFTRFPRADSGDLTRARSRAVCSPALASLSVKTLELHKILLVNNVELSIAIGRYVSILEKTSFEEIVAKGWRYDPPKAVSDVFESVIGAVFVDTGFNFEKAAVVVEQAMEGLLSKLSLDLPRDPVSQLMIWAAKNGCRRILYRYVYPYDAEILLKRGIGDSRVDLSLKTTMR